MFCDLVGSTELGESLDPEVLRKVLERYFDVARAAIERHGGVVEKFAGDAVVGSFGVPVAHEDDVIRAVRASLELRDGVLELEEALGDPGRGLQVRIAINTGEVFADAGAARDGRIGGDVFNTAARLQSAAGPGEIVVSRAAERMIHGAVDLELLGDLVLKGKAAPVTTYRVLGMSRRQVHHAAPLIGRERPLRRLNDALEDAVDAHACVFATVIAPAGVGKSRLATAFADAVGARGTVLIGQTPSYGDGVTFAPLVELLGHAAGAPGADAEAVADDLREILSGQPDGDAVWARLAQILGIGESNAGDAAWAVRRLFETLAASRPLIVILEDIHWAEGPMLDLVDAVAERLRGPVLVVCLSRPELLESRPTWSAGLPRSVTMTLQPLESEDARLLAEHLLGTDAPRAVVDGVCATAEGNALYLEQLAAIFADQGLIAGGAWVGPSDAHIEIPATLQALLAARCDQLDVETRTVLGRASIEGRRFRLEGVRALTADIGEERIDCALESLERRGFVEPEDATAGRWRFTHALLREAAYGELSKELRAGLHEELANWISCVDADEPDADETIARQLERALHLREELMLRDEHSAELAERAGALFAAAGERSFAAIDLLTSRELLTRAEILLPDLSEQRLELLPALGTALSETGRPAEAVTLLANGLAQAKLAGSERAVLRTTVGLASARLWGSPDNEGIETIAAELGAAAATLQESGDFLGLAEAAIALEYMEFWRGRLAASFDWCHVGLESGIAAGSAREATQAAADLFGHAVYGPLPFDEFEDAAEQLRGRGDPQSVCVCWALISAAALANDDRTTSRTAETRWREVVDGRGLVWLGATYELIVAKVEIAGGDPEAAERRLREARETLSRMGDLWWLTSVDSDLCTAVWAQGNRTEYLRLADLFETSATFFNDRMTLARRAMIRARSLLHRGSPSDAELAARDALRLLEGTDIGLDTAEAHLTLEEVLLARGMTDDATAAGRAAVECYRMKRHHAATAFHSTR